MNKLLEASKKIQTWIHSHPRKATIVRSVIDEFDNAIASLESQQEKAIPSDEDQCDHDSISQKMIRCSVCDDCEDIIEVDI